MKYNGNNLKEVLEAHKRWLAGFGYEDPENASKADFTGANLKYVDLSGVDLSDAVFNYANMYCAVLTDTKLNYADLLCADLTHATLIGANLSYANLCSAQFCHATLTRANLRYATLCFADFYEADLSLAILDNAVLTRAELRRAKQCPPTPMACPSEGSFIAWKKCLVGDDGEVIVKLKIPADAKRSSATNSKCRASKAKVLDIQALGGEKLTGVIPHSINDPSFTYVPGETVRPKEPFCKDRYKECASGIHFFVDRQEAVDYN